MEDRTWTTELGYICIGYRTLSVKHIEEIFIVENSTHYALTIYFSSGRELILKKGTIDEVMPLKKEIDNILGVPKEKASDK